MLIGFLGAPISGKTTTAAKLFASLKDDGYVAEFLPEQARVYIAERRAEAMQPGRSMRPLDDIDQVNILVRQGRLESLFNSVGDKRTIVITDCAAFLALLYMTPEYRARQDTMELAQKSAARFDLLFRCHPVHAGDLYDPGRVHSQEQSIELDHHLEDIIELVGVDSKKVVALSGPVHVRASRARYELTERMLCWK